MARSKTKSKGRKAGMARKSNPEQFREPDVVWGDTYIWYGPGSADEVEAITVVEHFPEHRGRRGTKKDDWKVTEYTHVGGYEMFEKGVREWIWQKVVVEASSARRAAQVGVDLISDRGGDEGQGTDEDLIELSVLPPAGMSFEEWKRELREENPRPTFQVHVYEEETEWTDPEDPDGYEQHTDEKVDDESATLEDVIGYAEEFGIQPRGRNDGTPWWTSYEDREYDFSRDVSRRYSMHVDRGGKPLDESTFNRINRLIKKVSGSRERVKNPKKRRRKRQKKSWWEKLFS